jgi:hypothetical protein
VRVFLVIAVLATLVRFDLPAQTAPTFTVVSIKANPYPPNYSGTHQITPGRVHFVHVALKRLILDAFRVKDYQLFSTASLTAGRWDVDATMPPESAPEQVASMLQRATATPGRLSLGSGGASSTFRIHGQGDIASLLLPATVRA